MSKIAREYHLIDLVGICMAGSCRSLGLGNSPVRRACQHGISSTAMFGSNTTIRDETLFRSALARNPLGAERLCQGARTPLCRAGSREAPAAPSSSRGFSRDGYRLN